MCLSGRPINHLSPTQLYIPRLKAPTKGRHCSQARWGYVGWGCFGRGRWREGGQDSSQQVRMQEVRGTQAMPTLCPVRQGTRPDPRSPFPYGLFHATLLLGGAITLKHALHPALCRCVCLLKIINKHNRVESFLTIHASTSDSIS